MKYFLIAGEASGDLHGGNLMASIQKADPAARFRFLGGDIMARTAGEPLVHYREMAFMGFINVLRNLASIRNFLNLTQSQIESWRPDVVILIDYPGFNLKIAAFCYKIGVPVYYYISPKIWAWKEYRIKKMKRYINELFVIFPFEVGYFREHSVEVHYQGNPLLDKIEEEKARFRSRDAFATDNQLEGKPIIAVLAGSRKQEIKRMLPVMLSLEKNYPSYQFVVAGAPSIAESFYSQYLFESRAALVFGQTYETVYHAEAALVTSGTAALETALLNTPQVVAYQAAGGRLGLWLARMVLSTRYISLVNIILRREAVTELLQHQVNRKRLRKELNMLLGPTSTKRKQMLADYNELFRMLGGAGASQRVAREMVDCLQTSSQTQQG